MTRRLCVRTVTGVAALVLAMLTGQLVAIGAIAVVERWRR